MIRVLHVAGGLEPELGGPTVAILNYIRASIDEHTRLHLVVTVDDPESVSSRRISESLAQSGAEVTLLRRTGRFKGKASRWGVSIPLASWLRRHVSEFDVVVVHGAWLFSSLAGVVVARFSRKPVIMIPHESLTQFDLTKGDSRFRVAAKSLLQRVYARACTSFVFASRMESSDSLARRNHLRRSVVPCPVVVESDFHRNSAMAGAHPLRIGFLGRLHPKKNLHLVIETLPHLRESVTLVVGGSGQADLRRSLEEHAMRLGVNHRIAWRGFIDAAKKDAFFEAIDVLVMPSAYESFGIVAAEAMLRGVPAVVSRRTGVAELIDRGGGGVVIEPTVADLGTALNKLDEDREFLQKLSAEGPQTMQRVSLSSVGAALREEYAQVAR